MGKIPFNVDAYTARLIGRENIATVDGGLLELIKNAYDASSSECFIYYEQKTNTLYIGDNGTGMTKDIITKHWMTIGNSSKRENFKRNGRIQTGSKGIGRFALDKLSSNCEMLTIGKEGALLWNVDWDNFGTGKNITETYAELNEVLLDHSIFMNKIDNFDLKRNVKEKYTNTGTIFKLEGLRDDWSRTFRKKIRNKLSMAIPPDNSRNFKLYFYEENQKKSEASIVQSVIDSYDYKIDFKVHDNGKAKINIHRNEFDFRSDYPTVKNEAGFTHEDFKYFEGKVISMDIDLIEELDLDINYDFSKIGSFYGELFFYKKTMTKKDKDKFYYKDFSGRRNLSERFGGIKVYRDNFRVKPYGDYGSSSYDWLLLDNRRAKSPAAISHPTGNWRVNSEQILGQIYISRLNINLEDQANREGIQETGEFKRFKEVVLSFIHLLEQDRQYIGRKLARYAYKMDSVAESEKKIIEKGTNAREKKKSVFKDEAQNEQEELSLPKTSSSATPKSLEEETISADEALAVIESKDQAIKNLEDENQMLRSLATTGIVTNTYMHEFKSIIQGIGRNMKLAEVFSTKNNHEKALEKIKEARRKRQDADDWFKVTIDSFKQDRRTMKNHSLNTIIIELASSWENALKNQNIKIEVDEQESLEIRCFPHEIESILTNLITNSITINKGQEDLKLNIELKEVNNNNFISYSDNGKGLSKKYKKNPYKVLEALESDKRDEYGEKIGTGMGMWIIDKTISSYNGKLDLDLNRELKKGFHIGMELPKRKGEK